jgi:cytidyltransferase-like protein
MLNKIFVSGSFDDLRSRHVRFLDEAAQLGPVHVLLWSDQLVQTLTGKDPKFPQTERQYFVEAIRYVQQVTLVEYLSSPDSLPLGMVESNAIWAVPADTDTPAKSGFCKGNGIGYRVIPEDVLRQFPSKPMHALVDTSGRKKVVVTGCYDWLHTGHVRFFEETSQLGDLHVVIGNDANVRFLKGEGHPLIQEAERLYMVHAIRYVTEAWISSGTGWMDAEPEIGQIRPHYYAVNEDGDKPEKRAFCQSHQLEYVVLKRLPKEGLPKRESTKLRGF